MPLFSGPAQALIQGRVLPPASSDSWTRNNRQDP